MQKHIESVLGLKDVHKKIEHWAANHDFNEADSDIGKETLKVTVVKNYGKSVKFRWGLCIGLLFIGGIFGTLAKSTSGGQSTASSSMGAFSQGVSQGYNQPADPVTSFLVLLFPLCYIGFYFYKKNGGMKLQASINASLLDGKTDIQIKSESDSEDLKNDILKLYNSLAE